MQTVDQKIFPSDTPVFREGDPGNAAYIVKKGRVEIWKMEDGERRILGVIGRGGIFGEMALVDNQPRMASATAVDPTTCLIITERSFQEKMGKEDAFIVALLRIFCRNIRAMQTPQ
jgi:CRP/FNR family transcriptional regulator, cyclic AMP receptor protein